MRAERRRPAPPPLTLEEACARLEAAAAQAPTVRVDGKFVFTEHGVCRECGCTDERACPGGCIWVEPNLCSRCVPRKRQR
jgi:hypothetical protein